MPKTLLFVHGTGVREPDLSNRVAILRPLLDEFTGGKWQLEVCAWGDALGAALNLRGASIPSYQRTGNTDRSEEAQRRARWTMLADDPLLELRITPKQDYLGNAPGVRIWAMVMALRQDGAANATIAAWMNEQGLSPPWADFLSGIAADAEWQGVISGLTLPPVEISAAVARALTSGFAGWLRERRPPGLQPTQRDALAKLLVDRVGGYAAGVLDWFAERATGFVRRRRGSLTDLTSPAIGDVLRYQAHGEIVRNLIGERVKATGARALLAHSLGGIACVDWLASAERPVDTLITVGSQAPYFYEIGALVSRRLGTGLPTHFPSRWLNVYDEDDVLSYPASGVFPGKVRDLKVEGREAFPESHSAYFGNRNDVWPVLADFLDGR